MAVEVSVFLMCCRSAMLVVSELSGCVCIAVAQGGWNCGSGPAWALQKHTEVYRPKAYGLKQLDMEKCHCLCPLPWALGLLPPSLLKRASAQTTPSWVALHLLPAALCQAWAQRGRELPTPLCSAVTPARSPTPSRPTQEPPYCPVQLTCAGRDPGSLCSPQLIPRNLHLPTELLLGCAGSCSQCR